MIREDFLQQNSYTPYDKVSPMWKTFWMLKNMLHFYDLAKHELNEAASGEKRVTYESIANFLAPQIQKLIQMKFVDPKDGEEKCVDHYKQLYNEIEDRFRAFTD
ncbi:V-type proton ATPase catalytic subunit A [Histomonas meleagridis]|nr:V-type proton ATPase catalytic subunit A [Histomonas meleagridis]